MTAYRDDGRGADIEDSDEIEDLDEIEARETLSRDLRTRGAMIAYRTALAICQDPKASAAAKASAVNSLLRAGGFFAPLGEDSDKQLHEMTPEEVQRALRKAEAQLEQHRRELDRAPGAPRRKRDRGSRDEDVFG
ncbi:hypothetical protein I8G32_04699 [Rhodopseudomonas palustris]|uniref:Uncharacterized protein n=1 Tax=Rhodopseudomonas palustris (strain ATCC BAA-98 / CGA009) TaxID=258594 RepID=Q6N166_RHOPA|nr:hypothetical protein [Rhodopseudomonas palustris]OPF96126.1 hypothetical protein B1S06_04465 [Rhodopseudomonas palustris]QQM06119.1 hypothetical protein I8G32_04699 [Rhodopseudomonas palustris]RJF66709.1 hypothetical protein D4Q71_05345 [Rhodopseudomonas palustris]WAB77438.1 hypothetical protein OR798_23620 [Rhodopseudomonas palustris]WCL94749.1 hypothetical protein TX73_023615 [Rhodopseudomonas palustris CGA009]